MGHANVVLDDELVAKCQKATGIKTRRALIDCVLRELLPRGRQKEILELKGKVRREENLVQNLIARQRRPVHNKRVAGLPPGGAVKSRPHGGVR
jgi:Arc/MetJ family transcription regulator